MAKLQKKSVIFFLLITDVVLIGYRISSLWNRFSPDFNVFYLSSLSLLHHQNPYTDKQMFTNFNYPIISDLLFLPFTLLTFHIAENFYLILNIISLLSIVAICLKILHKFTLFNYLLFLLGSLIFFPTNFTLGMGQSNLIAFAILLIGYYFSTKNQDIRSDLLLSIAYVTKPVLGLTILYFLFQKKYFKSFRILGLTCIVIAISIIFFGIQPYQYYLTKMIPPLLQIQGKEIYYNQGITGFIARITPLGRIRSISATLLEFILLIGTFFVAVNKKKENHLLFSLFITTLVLIDGLSWQHHFVFLLFPFMVCFFQIQKQKNTTLLSSIFIFSLFLTGTNIKQTSMFLSFPLSLILSHVFFGAVLLYVLIILLLFTPKLSLNNIYILLYSCFLLFLLMQYILFLSCRSVICFY